MANFIKKSVVIEAEQYQGDPFTKGLCPHGGNGKPHVHTIHNNQIVNIEIGDWIIPEPDGEHFYPCKPDIFRATYEEVRSNVSLEHP